MIDICIDWRYLRNGKEKYSVYAGNEFVCDTYTEDAAKLICKLPEFYDMVKEFIDPDLNPDFESRF